MHGKHPIRPAAIPVQQNHTMFALHACMRMTLWCKHACCTGLTISDLSWTSGGTTVVRQWSCAPLASHSTKLVPMGSMTAQVINWLHMWQEAGHCSGGMVITVTVGGAAAGAPAPVPSAAAGGSPQGSGTNHPLRWTFPQLIDPAATESYPPLKVAVGDTVTFEWPQDATSPHGVVIAPSGACIIFRKREYPRLRLTRAFDRLLLLARSIRLTIA